MKNPRYDYVEVFAKALTDYFAKDIEVKERTVIGNPEVFFDPVKGIFIFKVLSEEKD